MVQRVAVCVQFPDNVKDQLNKWGENVSLMSHSLMTLIVIGFTVATFIQCRVTTIGLLSWLQTFVL